MAITRSVQQQYENYVAVKSGVLQESMSLMYSGPVSEVEADGATKIVRGSVISLNDKGALKLGLGTYSATNCPMPMFAKKNIYDPDVMTGAVGATTKEILATALTGSRMSGYVATGAFEIETSTFDKDAAYTFNAPLTANADGQVTVAKEGVYGSEAVIGIVSRLPFRSKASMNVNGTGNNRVCFWSVFFPPKASAAQ